MIYDTIVRGGRIVCADLGSCDGDLAVRRGRIAAILPRGAGKAREEIDAAGLHVLPGLVDPHVHVEMGPGELRYAETRSAAIGGVTTIGTYVMNRRPFSELYEEELALIERDAVTDVVLHVGLVSDAHLAELPLYVDRYGVLSFKHFMYFKGGEGAHMGIDDTDDGHLYLCARAVSAYPRAVLAVHPENVEIIWRLRDELKAATRDDLAAYTDSRPDFVEAAAIATAVIVARATGVRLYIPHVTSARALETIGALAAEDVTVLAETCPHYLVETMYAERGALLKVNPPLRTEADVEALWRGIAEGRIVSVGSDHVPRRLDRKQGDIWTAAAGFPGLATMLPLMITEGAHRRGLGLETIVDVCARNAAKIFGLHPRKGTLQPGADADVVLVDTEAEHRVEASRLESFADYSPYEGRSLRGWAVRTLVRGRTVMVEGEIVAEPGYGRLVARSAGAAGGPDAERAGGERTAASGGMDVSTR